MLTAIFGTLVVLPGCKTTNELTSGAVVVVYTASQTLEFPVYGMPAAESKLQGANGLWLEISSSPFEMEIGKTTFHQDLRSTFETTRAAAQVFAGKWYFLSKTTLGGDTQMVEKIEIKKVEIKPAPNLPLKR